MVGLYDDEDEIACDWRNGLNPRSFSPSYAARAGQEAAALTISAAFSAIMMTGALVLPEVIVGMIEASTTRKPVSPCTRNSSLTTAPGSWPILHVPTT